RAAGGPDLLLQNTKAPGPKRDGSVSPGRKLVVRRGPIRPRVVVFVSASPRTALRKGSSKWAWHPDPRATDRTWLVACHVSEDLLDRLGALDANQLLVEPAVEVGQPVRIEAELMQDGRVQVLDVEALRPRRAAHLVRRADADPPLDPASCQPHREAVGVVVAAGPDRVLGGRLPAELTAPDDQRRAEQPAPLQVLQEAGDRF